MADISLSIFAAVGIGLAVMFFGYFFGLFEGRGQGYKRRKQEYDAEKSPAPLTPAAPPPPAPEAPSLLKLSLDRNKQLSLVLDGKQVNTSELSSEERTRLIDLMVSMRPWVQPGSGPTPAQAAPSPVRPLAAQTPSLASYAPQSKAGDPLSAGPISATSQAAPAPVPPITPPAALKEEPAPTSMVGQIEAILQKKVVGTPLADLGIHLTEAPQGGVTVLVGVKRYAGVGEVPDPQVQAVIKAAIVEWEKKYTPG